MALRNRGRAIAEPLARQANGYLAAVAFRPAARARA